MLNVTLAAPQRHEVLTILPLVSADPVELPYQLLSDALQAGALRITEIGAGTVPRLLATNDSDADVLVLDGEQLVGARQNRMTNWTILLPARSKTEIPVSCMEQGRWHFTSEEFAPAPQHSPATVRRHARDAEAAHAAAGGAASPEVLAEAQGPVWGEIADYAATLGHHSTTGALNDLYAGEAPRIDAWVASFPPVPGQVGLLALVGGEPIGMDVIGGCGLYARLHDRLLRGYVMDAIGARGGVGEPANGASVGEAHGDGPPADESPAGRPSADGESAEEAAQRFLDRVREVRRADAPTVGRGAYRVLSGTVVGGELQDDERWAHLSAFPAAVERGGGEPMRHGVQRPLPPPSMRRWFRGE